MIRLLRAGVSEPQVVSRRRMLELAGLNLVGLLASDMLAARGVAAATAPGSLTPLNRFPQMVQRYFVDQVRRAESRSLAVKQALASRQDAEQYVRHVREKIAAVFGPNPEKTPLNARVTGVVDRPTYTIEKLIFESRPEFYVTANLYVPKGRTFPLPGVVGTCGHSNNGKAEKAYQSFAQGLARLGYVVLIYDPMGQGERLQYTDVNLKSWVGVGVPEHIYAGNQQLLVGEFFGAWRAWDGIRALDYLLTREEVDKTQVGVTGNSGGGTMTTWLCGVEHRWTMAAPSCFVTTFRRNMENELPADSEQCPPRAIALGLDHDDFLAALAPKPIVILAKEKDYFDARGTEEAYHRLRHLYRLLGAEENISLFIGPTHHGYTQENREAMYRLFNRVTGVSTAQTEPEVTIEKDETLACAPRGQVAALKSRTVFSFTREKAEALAQQRKHLGGDALLEAIRRILKLPDDASAPEFRVLRTLPARQYPARHFTTYAVETEAGVHALVYRLGDEQLCSRPPRTQQRAILYVAHLSSDAELRTEPLIGEIRKAEPESVLYTCDVRGIGESQPDTCGHNTFHDPYGSDFFYASHALMLDYPYLGQKTYDVLRVLQWLAAYDHPRVHLVAKGWGALAGALAAVISEHVDRVTLKNALTSYEQLAMSERYAWPLATLPPNVLAEFDLPDCYAALAAKNLRQVEPWGALADAASA